jgi:uncharacterized LabA/DUF88 family protein
MKFYPNERCAVFIDGPNFYAGARDINLKLDYNLLLEFFRSRTHLVRCYYFTGVEQDRADNPLIRTLDYLEYHDFTVVTKPVKAFENDQTGQVRKKANMDIEIAVRMIKLAPALDHMVLGSGDGDFCAVVEFLQDQGKRVTVLSTEKANPNILSDDLKRKADVFLELDDLRRELEMKPSVPKTKVISSQ